MFARGLALRTGVDENKSARRGAGARGRERRGRRGARAWLSRATGPEQRLASARRSATARLAAAGSPDAQGSRSPARRRLGPTTARRPCPSPSARLLALGRSPARPSLRAEAAAPAASRAEPRHVTGLSLFHSPYSRLERVPGVRLQINASSFGAGPVVPPPPTSNAGRGQREGEGAAFPLQGTSVSSEFQPSFPLSYLDTAEIASFRLHRISGREPFLLKTAVDAISREYLLNDRTDLF